MPSAQTALLHKPLSHKNTLSKSGRKPRALLACGTLLIILGLGNLGFAQYKFTQYSHIVSAAQAKLASPLPTSRIPILGHQIGSEKQAENVQRLLTRLDFYSFIVMGGKVVSLLGLVMVLVYLANASRQKASALERCNVL
jgi:hypothetical protein